MSGESDAATADAGAAHVRDSEDVRGPVFSVPASEWSAFVAYAAVKRGY